MTGTILRIVFEIIESHAWPGNVRELRNVCERLVVFAGNPLPLDQLPPSVFADGRQGKASLVRLEQTVPPIPLRERKTRIEKEYIESVRERARWNFTAAAKRLEIQRTYQHQKVNTLGISRPRSEGERGPVDLSPASRHERKTPGCRRRCQSWRRGSSAPTVVPAS